MVDSALIEFVPSLQCHQAIADVAEVGNEYGPVQFFVGSVTLNFRLCAFGTVKVSKVFEGEKKRVTAVFEFHKGIWTEGNEILQIFIKGVIWPWVVVLYHFHLAEGVVDVHQSGLVQK